ncbi:MAG TPA: patatin-like phospholipase family protein [Candidatus Saccharimonadales bacterium]|nr:patatin-like phospholipase family protein [Candidatus Saccharimonadales bacterium]
MREDLPFARPAVVLSGGGALGAYQVGVLRVLRQLGLRPAIVSGVSVGAMNAVAWVAQGFETAQLERTWLHLGPSSMGFRWTTLILRVAGLFLAALAGIEIVLTLFGSPNTGVARLIFRRSSVPTPPSWAYDSLAWLVVGSAGLVSTLLAPRAEVWLANASAAGDPERWQRWLGRGLLAVLAVHLVTWALAWPWPHRFSATLLLVGALAWLANRQAPSGRWLRRVLAGLLPESGGRGLWQGLSRRRVLESLTAQGDPARLTSGVVRLLMTAVAVDTGRMCHFVNWGPPDPAFRDSIHSVLGEVMVLRKPEDLIQAAAASSAIPIVFQPVRVQGREFVDAGLLSSQVVRATVAAGADALLVVVMSPAVCPHPVTGEMHLFELGARLIELGTWRDLRSELGGLPAPWSRGGRPARVCLVEPDSPLPGGFMRIEPHEAAALERRGAEDAWRALDRAGWLAEA